MNAFEEAAEVHERLAGLPPAERTQALERSGLGPEARALARAMLAGEERLHPGLDTEAAPGAKSEGASFEPGGARYRILGELARGGMGVVLRGRDQELGREVAIKVLRSDHGAARARFLGEAQVAGQLQHPGVVPIYELGSDVHGRPFFAMKLVEGETLAELLAARSSPAAERRRFLGVFRQLCQTMAYAHSRGVIHRDLKPANVMVGAFGEVQVLDWGLAKVLGDGAESGARAERPQVETVRTRGDSSGSASVSGSVMGTPQYMPPEQARGEIERLDRRADVFTLGAILCQILSGDPPFPGDREEALRQARAAELGPAYERLERSGADPQLVALARRALAASPAERPADAGVLSQELERHASLVEERLRAAELAAEAARVRAESERRARRLTAGLALAAVALVLFVAGGLAWRARERGRRVAGLSAEVGRALDAAVERLGRARAAAVEEEAPWEAASLALGSAERLLASGETENGVRERATRLRAELEGERESAAHAGEVLRRDRALVARLEEIRAPRGEGADPYDYARMEREYRAALGEYGLDPSAPEAAARLAESAIATELAHALDQWAVCHRTLAQGDPDELAAFAARLLELAEAADPDPARVRIRGAVRARDLAALQALANGDLAGEGPESMALLAAGLRLFGDLASAIALLERAVSAHRGDFWLHFHLATFRRVAEDGKSLAAVPHFHAALGARPNSLETRHQLGQNLIELGRREEAAALFEELTRLEPGNGHWRAHLGDLLDQRGEHALAILEEAVALAPDDGYALSQLGHAYIDAGRPWRALEPLRRDHELFPSPRSALALGYTLMRLGDYDAAYPLMLVHLEAEADHALGLMHLATLVDSLGRPEQAEQSLRRALELQGDLPEAHCNLGRLLRDRGALAESLELYRRCDALGRRNPGWAFPTEEWVAWVERCVAYDGEMELYLEQGMGEFAPEDALEIAQVAGWTGWTRAAAAWYAELLAPMPDSVPGYQNYSSDAAGFAARACAGDGRDAGGLAPEERVALARQALEWMHASLARIMRNFEVAPVLELKETRIWLQSWRHDPAIAALRPDGPIDLPPDLRAGCRELWAGVDAALTRLDEVQASLD